MEWINIKERLPEDGQEVLCWNGNINLAFYNKQRKGGRYEWDCDTYEANNVTYWAEIPKPTIDKG